MSIIFEIMPLLIITNSFWQILICFWQFYRQSLIFDKCQLNLDRFIDNIYDINSIFDSFCQVFERFSFIFNIFIDNFCIIFDRFLLNLHRCVDHIWDNNNNNIIDSFDQFLIDFNMFLIVLWAVTNILIIFGKCRLNLERFIGNT